MVTWDEGCISFADHDSDWIVDSGASFHVTAHGEYFSSYTAGEYGKV